MITNEYNPKWIENFTRELGIRKAIILNGNLNDLFYYKNTQSYHSILPIIKSILKEKGFDEKKIISWNQFEGIDSDCETIKELENNFEEINNDENQSTSNYNMGDDDDDQNKNETDIDKRKTIEEFLPFIYPSFIKQTDKRVYIIDWSQYLFTEGNSLPEKERKWITIISKMLRDSEKEFTFSSIQKQSSIILFLLNGHSTLPASLVVGNPLINSISVSLPERTDKEFFINKYIDTFNFENEIDNEIKKADFIDSLDNLTIRDLTQLIKLSHQTEDALSPNKLINMYKYGLTSSPWEELSKDKLSKTKDVLSERVKGQDEAIEKLTKVVIRAFTGLSGLHHSAKQKKPKGTLFFVGPTGVGKTELAKSLAEFLFGDEEACLRFDMSEYSHEHADQRLVGAPPGYVGYEKGGQLTNAIKDKPFSVILFDEIEKAHPKILDKFLQILEDGRLTDGKGETVSFSESIIIFTSNIGAAGESDQSESKIDMNYSKLVDYFKNEVTHHFNAPDSEGGLGRPELLNRIGDNIVVFNYITSNDVMQKIAKAKLKPLYNFIKERFKMELHFENEDSSLKALIGKVNKEHGGRGILNVIEPNIIDPLSEFIFENRDEFYPGKKIVISQFKDTARFTFELE